MAVVLGGGEEIDIEHTNTSSQLNTARSRNELPTVVSTPCGKSEKKSAREISGDNSGEESESEASSEGGTSETTSDDEPADTQNHPPILSSRIRKSIKKDDIRRDILIVPSTPHPNVRQMVLTTPINTPLIAQVDQKWNRPIEQLPVKADFPRMFSRISVLERDVEVWKPFIDREVKGTKECEMKNFFILLCERLQERDLTSRIDSEYFSIIPDGISSTGVQLGSYIGILFENVIGEHSALVGIVKCINQAVVVPAVIAIRQLFMGLKTTYKDCRGMWDVVITFEDDSVTVTHKKWEETIPPKYEFCWHLSIELNKTCNIIKNVDLKIAQVRFLTLPPQQEMVNLFNHLKQYYDPESDHNNNNNHINNNSTNSDNTNQIS